MARTPPSTSTERSRTDVIVAIAGAHGKIALRLMRLLSADGDSVIGLIRNPDQATDVSDRGGSPVLCDLESASEGRSPRRSEVPTQQCLPPGPEAVAARHGR